MIKVGQINKLVVKRALESGYILSSINSDDREKEVFLPFSMMVSKLTLGSEVEVFIYSDNDGKLIASEEHPEAVVGEYAWLRVIEAPEFGAFFEWGIDKDLLVPGNEQKIKVRPGEFHIVRICLEEETGRVFGTTKFGKYTELDSKKVKAGEKAQITPVLETDLGYKSLINKSCIGMIYHNEIFKNIRIGFTLDGVVKKVREDGLVDASLQAHGIKKLTNAKDIILDMLVREGGKSSLHDKSSPEDIKRVLGMSKKSFKNALGMLYKEKKVQINKDGIVLL